jgi:hypothetical protein
MGTGGMAECSECHMIGGVCVTLMIQMKHAQHWDETCKPELGLKINGPTDPSKTDPVQAVTGTRGTVSPHYRCGLKCNFDNLDETCVPELG